MAQILVVEDEAALQEVLQAVLEQAGYDVVTAANGAEGLQRYEQAGADLVITDMQMPVMDGGQLILGLSRRFPAVKILAISGDPGALAQARAFPVQGTLHKPFRAQELLRTVEQLVSKGWGAGEPAVGRASSVHDDPLRRHDTPLAGA